VHVDGVLTIRLDRNEQRPGLDGLLQVAATEPEVRVVVLRVASSRVIAGSTRNSATAPSTDRAPSTAGARCRGEPGMTGFVEGFRALQQPVVAIVAGSCDAAGLAILDACDIVFAAEDAHFALPGQAPIDGREAERRGLVTLSFPANDLDRETETLARELAAKDPMAVRFTKQTLRSVGALDWDAVLAFNAAKVAELAALRAGKPSPQDLAVQSFLTGKSKPGLGT
jgi:enoyl-CoA hydratase/carnithine racemase